MAKKKHESGDVVGEPQHDYRQSRPPLLEPHGFPGENLAAALKWFVEHKSEIEEIMAWVRDNKDAVAEALSKVNRILDMLGTIHSRLPLAPLVT